MKIKELLIICTFQLAGVTLFSQTHDPEPVLAPKSAEPQIMMVEGEPVYDIVDEPANFPGGLGEMRKFLTTNLQYPKKAEELGIQGKCYLKLVIWKTGEIKDVKIKKGVSDCPECDQEAIRLVRLMPNWIPAKIKGEAVNSYFLLPMSFRIF